MRYFLSIFLLCFILVSFVKNEKIKPQFMLKIEAKGCHYQLTMNNELIDEGKTYQQLSKTIDLTEKLSEEEEQTLRITMMRISREIPLKVTQAYVYLTLEKSIGDSIEIIRSVKLPTFQYDEEEDQPQSIGGSIQFKQ